MATMMSQDRFQESGRLGLLRIAYHLPGRADLVNLALVEEGDVVRHLTGKGYLVGDDDHRSPFGMGPADGPDGPLNMA